MDYDLSDLDIKHPKMLLGSIAITYATVLMYLTYNTVFN